MTRIVTDRISFIGYLVFRFFFRISEFLRRWYVVAGLFLWKKTIERIQSLDRTLALKVTIVYFFQPLFGDKSIIGRILGFFFRIWRILLATVLYVAIISVAVALYILWALFPVFVISKILIP